MIAHKEQIVDATFIEESLNMLDREVYNTPLFF